MTDDRVAFRELRPWLWLPGAALVFLTIAWSLNYLGIRDWVNPAIVGICAVIPATIIGGAATYLPGNGVRPKGAVGSFAALTIGAEMLAGLVLALASALSDSSTRGDLAGLFQAAIAIPLLLVLTTGWMSVPIGGAAGYLAWRAAARKSAYGGTA